MRISFIKRSLAGLLVVLFWAMGCGGAPEAADSDGVRAAELERAPDPSLWTCGMHPQIVQDHPGQCPICGMDLVPMRGTAGSEGVVRIDPVTIQNIGVRTALVEIASVRRSTRATGRFEASERGRAIVAPKIGGWIESLHVNYEGARVRRGQPLLDLYSPELVSTQEEFLLALRNARRLEGSAGEEDAKRLVDAARRRLSYWDLTAEQIAELERSGVPRKTVTFFAPASGTVTALHVAQGQQIRSGEPVIELHDLSSIWLIADVFEQDLSWVRVGVPARVSLSYEPGAEVGGKVDYIYDTLNEETRSARIRISLPNPGYGFKPGMYATVTLEGAPSEPRPTVPSEALVRTGERDMVIIALGEGRFRPVEVEPGLEADDHVQILAGLSGGERVVTSAQFLIDSEARLQSAVNAMLGGPSHEHAAAATSSEANSPIDLYALDANGDGKLFQCGSEPGSLADSGVTLTSCEASLQEVTLGAAHTALHKHGSMSAPVSVLRADKNADGQVYQCPMDWAVLHDGPGRCEVCGMNLQAFGTEEARANLEAAGYRVGDNAVLPSSPGRNP